MQKSLLVCLVLFGTASAVSPVGKVIELLDDLKGKVQNDLAKEGAAMEEYSGWCETEQSDYTYAIKTATSKIADLSAAMADGEAQASAFATQISELGSTIASKETELAEAADMRKTDRANFESTEKELLDTVDELSRGVMKVKQGAALLQQTGSRQAAARLQKDKSLADVLSKIVEAAWVDQAGKRRLTKFIQASEGDDLSLSQPQANVKSYESHSGGIVGTLTDMQEKAEGTLSDARKNEMKGQHNYALVKMGIEEEIKLLKKKLGDATAGKSGAEQALAAAAGEKAEVEKTKAADEIYLQTVTLDCKTKADEWAARQKSATEELAAVDKAKEILSSGVKVFVQVTAKAHSMVKNDDDDLASTKTRMRVVEQLKNMGRQFNSFRLVQLASSASQDPFGKVRGLINNMIEALVKEANEEASAKAFCDEELAKSNKAKDEKMLKLDQFQSRIDGAATTKAELQQDIKTLQGELAEIDKATAEATKIRTEEHEEYLVASSDYKQASEAVMSAISVLKNYYEGAFIQLKSTKKQPSFGSAKSDAGGSIIEILEVAESDFTKLLMETETQETEAASAFETLSQESAVSKTAKSAEIRGKESEIKSLSVALTHHTEDKGTTAEELDAVMAYLSKLKPECASKTMSYEERKARREAEIEGLRESLAILEGTGVPPAFIQTRKGNLRRHN